MVVNIGSNSGTTPSNSFIRPDNVNDTDATYFYFGWESVNGGWLVRRQLRSTSAVLNAKALNNGTFADLTAAWASKETLTYV